MEMKDYKQAFHKATEIHHQDIIYRMQLDMERLAMDPNGYVKEIKPLLSTDAYSHALSHFMQAHDATVKRYMASYMGFLGEDVSSLGQASPYAVEGGMHLDQL